jgi:CheY-like chemotaxis protein
MPVMGGAATARVLRRLLGNELLLIGMTGDPPGCVDRNELEAAGLNQCLDKDTAGMQALRQALEAHAQMLAQEGALRVQAKVPSHYLRNRFRS